MRVAAGRQIFFDKIAESLQLVLGPDAPKKIALSQNPAGATVPESDIHSLARALCRLHAPWLESIPVSPWSDDGIGVAAIFDAEDRKLREVCDKINSRQNIPDAFVIINFEDDGHAFPKLIYDPRSQSDIVSSALKVLFSTCSGEVPTLARVRYEISGFKCLEADFGLFEQPEEPDWQNSATLEQFYYRLSRSWNYRGGILRTETIQEWANQLTNSGFGNEATDILIYLMQYGFVTEKVVANGLFKLYSELKNNSKKKSIEISIQKPGKSEQKLAYLLRPPILLDSLESVMDSKNTTYMNNELDLYCFDDCICSGESLTKYLFDEEHNVCSTDFINLLRNGGVQLNVVVYHADQRGIDAIQNHPDACGAVKVHAARILDESHQAFSEKSRIFKDKKRREEFKEFCLEIGEHLNPCNPLGWENGQLCIAYDYTIPDNSLPILYGEGNTRQPWKPLFVRAR